MLRILADESGVGVCSERCKRAEGRGKCHCVCRGRNHGMYQRRHQAAFVFEDDQPLDWKLK